MPIDFVQCFLKIIINIILIKFKATLKGRNFCNIQEMIFK